MPKRWTTVVLGAASLLSARATAQPVPPQEAPPRAPAAAEEAAPTEPAAPGGRGSSGVDLAAPPEAVAAPVPPTVPAPPPAAAAPPPAPAAAPAASTTDRLSVGTEAFFRPGLLLQGWFLLDRADETTSTFRVRRAELHVRGEIVPHLVGYALMLDPAKVLEPQDKTITVANQDPSPSDPDNPESVTVRQPVSAVSVFQDFFITLQSDWVELSVGQFKIPVSWEGYNSSSKLLFPERAPVAREFGDKRDLGLRLAKTFRWFGYSAGLFNGATLNNLDNNGAKDVALRLEGYPVEGLVLGAVGYASTAEWSAARARARFEGDLRFERGPFLFQSELIRAHDVSADGEATNAQGFYAALAWTFFEMLQPCVRVGYLDPDAGANLDPATANGKDELWHLDVGLNYYLRKHEAKLQLSFNRFQFEDATPNNELVVAAQASF